MATISYSREGNVGVIEMNGPPANSYGISFMRELDAAIDAAEGDEACRVVVLRSAVPSFFCGGADIKQFHGNTPAQNIEMITVAHETLGRLAGSRRIYIAEINGHALGGGLEIALAARFTMGQTLPWRRVSPSSAAISRRSFIPMMPRRVFRPSPSAESRISRAGEKVVHSGG